MDVNAKIVGVYHVMCGTVTLGGNDHGDKRIKCKKCGYKCPANEFYAEYDKLTVDPTKAYA